MLLPFTVNLIQKKSRKVQPFTFRLLKIGKTLAPAEVRSGSGPLPPLIKFHQLNSGTFWLWFALIFVLVCYGWHSMMRFDVLC